MKRAIPVAALVFLFVACSGCETVATSLKNLTPKDKVSYLRVQYTLCVETITELAKTGNLSASSAEKFEEVRVKVAGALDQAEAMIDAGQDFSTDDLAASLNTLQSIVLLILTAVTHG